MREAGCSKHFVLAVLAEGASADWKARRLSASGVGAGAWLTAMPLFPALQLSADVFRTALRIRLGLPHPILAAVARCLCGVTPPLPSGERANGDA
eukprot:jgi/Chlat1/5250/Chrsp33S00386